VPPVPVDVDPQINMGGLGKDQFWYGSSKLWTMLPIDGIWRGWQRPSKPGDFVYDNKMPWFRMHPAFSPKDGPLTITGKRLDGLAPSFTETFQSNGFAKDEDNAMIMGGISIPAFGCWQVIGHYKDQQLSFTVWVAPLAEQKQSVNGSTPMVSPERSGAAPLRIHIDGTTQAKSLLYKVTPTKPADASNVSGNVVLHAVIGEDGRPHELEYVSGPPILAQVAIDAVTWWQYRVATVGDEPAEVDTTIEVVFPPTGN